MEWINYEYLIQIFNGCMAIFIGCIAAFAELLSRYKTFKPIWEIAASRMYLFINGIASLIAYIFIVQFNIVANDILRVLLAGTSSLIILRSSFANIKVGEKNVEAGIGAILQVFLNYADRSFDQQRSKNELSEIEEIMKKIDFEKAKLALPTTCFTIMKNVSDEEQKQVSSDVQKLSVSDLDNKTKSLNLGILLSNITGLILLKKAVEVLPDSLNIDNIPTPIQKLDEVLNKLREGKK